MKRNLFTLALAVLLTAGLTVGLGTRAYADGNPKLFSGTVTVTGTNTTLTGTSPSIPLYEGDVEWRDITKVEIDNQSGLGTGTVTVAVVNLGGGTETVATSGALAPGSSYVTYPVKTTTVTDTAYVVTGNVAVAVSPIRTIDIGNFKGRMLKVSIAQTNASSTNALSTVYKYNVYAE